MIAATRSVSEARNQQELERAEGRKGRERREDIVLALDDRERRGWGSAAVQRERCVCVCV